MKKIAVDLVVLILFVFSVHVNAKIVKEERKMVGSILWITQTDENGRVINILKNEGYVQPQIGQKPVKQTGRKDEQFVSAGEPEDDDPMPFTVYDLLRQRIFDMKNDSEALEILDTLTNDRYWPKEEYTWSGRAELLGNLFTYYLSENKIPSSFRFLIEYLSYVREKPKFFNGPNQFLPEFRRFTDYLAENVTPDEKSEGKEFLKNLLEDSRLKNGSQWRSFRENIGYMLEKLDTL